MKMKTVIYFAESRDLADLCFYQKVEYIAFQMGENVNE